MGEPQWIIPGVRVRCLTRDFNEGREGPGYGWVGEVVDVEAGEGLFVVYITWDALRGNRAARRKGGIPLHVWAFDSERLAVDYLEVLTPAPGASVGQSV